MNTRMVALLTVLGVVASACASGMTDAEVDAAIAEAVEDAMSSTLISTASTTLTTTTIVTEPTTTTVSTTVNAPPTIAMIRQDFEDGLAQTFQLARSVLDNDPPSVEVTTAACDLLYGVDVCPIVREFTLHASPSYDVVETDSIVAPFRATATVGYTLTATTVDEAGKSLDERTEDFLSFLLHWEYVDGVWNLVDVAAPGTGFDLMALNLFMFGVPPSEYFALDH